MFFLKWLKLPIPFLYARTPTFDLALVRILLLYCLVSLGFIFGQAFTTLPFPYLHQPEFATGFYTWCHVDSYYPPACENGTTGYVFAAHRI